MGLELSRPSKILTAKERGELQIVTSGGGTGDRRCENVQRLNLSQDLSELFATSIMGHTCSWDDIIMTRIELPLLMLNDWVMFINMGSYTSTMRSTFNGLPMSQIIRCRILK